MFFSVVLYNTILVFSIIFSYFSEWSKTKLQRLFSRAVLFLILFIPAALRYRIGTDYDSYVDIYDGNLYGTLEVGFLFILDICHYLNMSSIQFIALMSFMTLFPICFLLKRKYFSWLLPLYVIFFYLQTYSLIRQALCVSFLICSIQFFIDQRYWKSLIFVLLGFLFHFSAVLIVPFLLIGRIKLNPYIAFITTLLMVIFLLRFNFLEFIFNSSIFQSSKYVGYENSSFVAETQLGSGSGVIAAILFPLVFMLKSKNVILSNRNNSLLVILTVFFIIAQVLSAKIHIFNRVYDTIRYLPMFLYPYFYFDAKVKNGHIVVLMFLVISVALFEKNMMESLSSLGSGLGIMPYVSIFN